MKSPSPPSSSHLPPSAPSSSAHSPSLSPTAFTSLANSHLESLQSLHALSLNAGSDHTLLSTTQYAVTLRRATILYVAASDILPVISQRASLQPNLANLSSYLGGVIDRMADALRKQDWDRMRILVGAAENVLDEVEKGRGTRGSVFKPLAVKPISSSGAQGVDVFTNEEYTGENSAPDDEDGASPGPGIGRVEADNVLGKKGRRWICGLNWGNLGRRDKLVLLLYCVMVFGALIAVAFVTVDFVKQETNPGSFIRTHVSNELVAPVVTVCLSQRGVPFSRLQLFNFTNAEGINLRGADPFGKQTERQSPEFAEAVERFWDNPLGEDCDEKVGDFYPFPVANLNKLMSGEETTQCRQCFRVGSRVEAMVRSTDFRNASVLELYTDNYFLQCTKSVRGLNERSKEFLWQTVLEKRVEMENLGVLASSVDGVGVGNLGIKQFRELSSVQLCNVFYFGYFPKALNTGTGGVDIKYEWDGDAWNRAGDGPYLMQTNNRGFLPEESLQLFVSTKRTSVQGNLGKNRDMVLIGPNTQTLTNFRPIVVYGEDRYDISSSTSNLMEDDVIALFGYWLVYRIYYNYNRFVTDEWYRESTYPASQWFVDFTGYASLFTGASLFSLLLLPLLRTMKNREKLQMLKKRPEVYLWSQHKQRYHDMASGGALASLGMENQGPTKRSSVVLPGYNV